MKPGPIVRCRPRPVYRKCQAQPECSHESKQPEAGQVKAQLTVGGIHGVLSDVPAPIFSTR